MTIQEQIQRDVALVSENSYLQTQLYNFLKLLKANMPRKHNVDEVLALAGTIDDTDAQEITQIINDECQPQNQLDRFQKMERLRKKLSNVKVDPNIDLSALANEMLGE